MRDDLIVGAHVLVKLYYGIIKFGTIKAIVNKVEGVRLQVDFGVTSALIHPDQVIEVL